MKDLYLREPIDNGGNWVDFLPYSTNRTLADESSHLISLSTQGNWLKSFVRSWHNAQEQNFSHQLLVTPDGYTQKILSSLKLYLSIDEPTEDESTDDKPKILLDIGGGTGRWNFLSKAIGYHHIVVDIANPKYLSLSNEILYCRASADDLPFKQAVAKAVVSFEMLEHCRYPEKVIQEIARVLKPKGLLILTTRQYWKTHGSPQDFYRYTRFGLEQMLLDNCLNILETIPMGGPASIIASVVDQNIPLLSKPLVKQLVLYPLWYISKQIDSYFFLNKENFHKNPDTTGWLIIATKAEQD